jgi:hypothetical protein
VIKIEFIQQIFKKNYQISNFMKIRPLGAELFHADGQTGRLDEAKGLSSHFCEGVYAERLPDARF